MDPPSEIYPLKMTSEWKCALEKSLIDAAKFPLPMEVFKDHADLRSHFFTVGMKLETVNMSEPFHICPASVTKVFNNHFFQVTIDDLRPEPSKVSMLCHADSLGILPVQWCLKMESISLLPKATLAMTLTGQIITSSTGQKKHLHSASEIHRSVGVSQRT